MTRGKYRVLILASHPTQYSVPVFRLMARDPRLEIQVAYCSLQGAKPGYDAGFGREIAWDIPLLDGYPWVELPNRSFRPGIARFWGLVNPGVWRLVREGGFDAVSIYTGYVYATFWIAVAAAKRSRAAVLFGSDAHELAPRDARGWKTAVKRRLWPRLFRLADAVIVPSTGAVGLMRSLGIPEDRIALTPYVVDNDRWKQAAARVDRAAVRARWGIAADAPIVVFSAKLQPWKRPLDALRAFAQAAVDGSYLLFAGEGPLRGELETEIARLGAGDRVKLLGFVNQSALPEVYRAADVLVLPSQYEPFGVVVNEAMLCECVPVVTDRVGARFDLVEEGRTGFVYPAGDVGKLAELLRLLLGEPERRARMSRAASEKIAGWSPELNVNLLVDAIARARGDAAAGVSAGSEKLPCGEAGSGARRG
jgi:glycosyltransferase involved in cell wall biosynthesis